MLPILVCFFQVIKLEIDSYFCIICTVLSKMLRCSQNETDFKVYGFLADMDMKADGSPI